MYVWQGMPLHRLDDFDGTEVQSNARTWWINEVLNWH